MTETEAYLWLQQAIDHVSMSGQLRCRDARARLWGTAPDNTGYRKDHWRNVIKWCQSDPEWQVALMIARLEVER